MKIKISEEDLYTRGGTFDNLLSVVFDAAMLVDADGYILHHYLNSTVLTKVADDSVGKHFSEINPTAQLDLVLKTKKAHLGIIDVVQGRKCIVNLYPIFSGEKLVGVLATILYSNLNALKQIVARINETSGEEAGDIYNTLARIGSSYTFQDYIGDSAVVDKIIYQCRLAANSNNSVLLIGETGTGKEILAGAIHSEFMGKSWRPFIKLNCSAIPKDLLESELFGHEKGAFTGAIATKKGKFELASGGSILLDEIGDMDLLMQSKLLRILEEKEYERIGGIKMMPMSSRVIASTNCNLREKCRQNTFRSDLYYRLSTIEIKIPPLRERKEDIPVLIKHFIKRDQLDFVLDPDALEIFYQYNWPGNVRELRNIVNRIGTYCSGMTVSAKDVYPFLEDSIDYESPTKEELTEDFTKMIGNMSPAELEKQWIIQVIHKYDFNITEAAKHVGVSRATMYNKIKKHNIDLEKQV